MSLHVPQFLNSFYFPRVLPWTILNRSYLVLTITLPNPLVAVISTWLAELSKPGDWYVLVSVLLNGRSMITFPSPVVA